MAFADKYRKGGTVSFGSQYRKDVQGIAPIKRQPIVPKRIPIQETDRYRQAVVNAERASEAARKAGSFSNIAKETGKGVVKALAEYIPKTVVSLAETPGTFVRGTAKQKTYNLPIIGKFKSYQSEAEDTANEIIEGRKPLYSALRPFVEVPLNLLPFAKGSPKFPVRSYSNSQRILSQGVAQTPARITKTTQTGQRLLTESQGSIPSLSVDPVSFGASYRRSTTPNTIPQVLSTPRKIITSGETILRKSGVAGNEMADLLRRQQISEDLTRGQLVSRLKGATTGISKRDLEHITDILEGKATPANSKVAQAAQKMRAIYDDVAKKAQEMKFEVRVPGGKSVPFTPRENYAPRVYNFDELTKASRREELLQHLVDSGQARNKAEASKLFDDFISANAERRAGNLENARLLDLPGYEKNAAIAGEKYLQTAAQRFTEAENFGKGDEVIADLIGKIADSGGDYMEAQRVFDFLTKGVPKSKVVKAVTQFNLATKLDLGAITNITQSVNTITKGGVGNFLKAVVSGKEGRQLSELAGVYDDMVILKETGVNPGKFVRGVMYLFGKVERMNRFLAANTGRFRTEELFKIAKKDPNAAYAVRQLKTLGINPAAIEKLTERDILVAMNRMSELTQFKPTVLNIPPAWKTPFGRLVTQFKSFAFMQTRFITNEILKEAKQGNVAPLFRFIATVPLFSYVANQTRNLATNRDEYDDKRNLDLRDFDKWFGAGKSFYSEPITQGDFLADTYANPYATPLKKVTRSLGTFLGPSFGEVGNTLVGLEDAAKKIDQNRTWYKDHPAAQEDPYLQLKRQATGSIPILGEYLKNTLLPFGDTPAEKARKKAIQAIQTGNVDLLIEAQQTDPYLRKQGAFQALLREAGKSAAKLNQQKQYQGFYDPTPKKKKEAGTSSFYTR